jgi:putative membrane protein
MSFTTASSLTRKPFTQNKLLQVCGIVFLTFWIGTFINTPNRTNWFTENTLVVIFLLSLSLTYTIFKFSDFGYLLMTIYLLLHIYGAEYTYAENPFGYWLKETLHLNRNHYDRIVHCSFGLLLAYPMRDYFKNHFQWPNWVCWVLPCEITLSFSAMYELIEWLVADIFFPAEGVAYLGSQGDIWDAQKDMGIAFVGSLTTMFVFSTIKRIYQSSKQSA